MELLPSQFLTLTILFFGVYQGGVLFFLSTTSKEQSIRNKVLFGSLIICLILRLLEFTLQRSGLLHPSLYYFSVPLTMLVAPLFYLYIQNSFYGFKLKLISLLHLIPFITSIIFLVPFYNLDDESTIIYLQLLNEVGRLSTNHVLYMILAAAQFTIYAVIIIKLLRSYFNEFTMERSDEKIEMVKWVVNFSYIIIAYISLYFLANFSLLTYPKWYQYLELVNYLGLAFVIQILLLFFIKTRFSGLGKLRISKPKYYSSNIQGMNFDPFIEKLRKVMIEEKLYLDSDLRIGKLASILNIPAPHMSQMISEGAKTTFYDFVNEYRIEEAKKLLISDKYERFTLLAIAMESGFNNKTTFNRTFKRHTKMTPTNYLKKHKNDQLE